VRARVVFDSNVYIAAAANPSGYARMWLRGAAKETRSYELYISEPIISEVERVLARMKVAPETVATLIELIREVAIMVVPTEHVDAVARDPNDNMILECALAADAHMVVSSDKDLVQLRQFRGIYIYPTSYLKYAFPQDFDGAA